MAEKTGEAVGAVTESEGPVIDSATSRREQVVLWIDNRLRWVMTIPAVIVLLALTFYPLVRAVQLSTVRYVPVGKRFVGLGNYVDVLTDQAFLNSLWITAQFTGIAVTTEFVLGFAIAVLLNKKLRFRGVWQTLIIVPMILSGTVVGLVWRLLYAPSGLLDFLLAPIFGGNIGWVSEPNIALYSIIITDVWQWTPLVVLVMFAGLQSIPDHVRESAIMDGASRWQRFKDITIPYLRTLIVTVLIIRVIDTLRVFAKVFILTRGGPSNATNIISIKMYREAFRFSNFGRAAAMAIILLGIVMVLSISFVKIADISFG
jgi:multiple sugar transport system permease protein